MHLCLRAAPALLAAIILAGCVAATAVPISREVWRLQVTVEDYGDPELVESRVIREAASLAFRNGAPYFLLRNASPRDPVADAARAVLYGDTRLFLIAPGRAPTGRLEASVIVELLDEDDPRVARAFRTLEALDAPGP